MQEAMTVKQYRPARSHARDCMFACLHVRIALLATKNSPSYAQCPMPTLTDLDEKEEEKHLVVLLNAQSKLRDMLTEFKSAYQVCMYVC